MLFPNFLQCGARGGQGCEVEAHVGSCSGYGCAEGSEPDHDICNKRRIAVGSEPAEIFNGVDGPLPQNR